LFLNFAERVLPSPSQPKNVPIIFETIIFHTMGEGDEIQKNQNFGKKVKKLKIARQAMFLGNGNDISKYSANLFICVYVLKIDHKGFLQ
jgi:hypothetical protein